MKRDLERLRRIAGSEKDVSVTEDILEVGASRYHLVLICAAGSSEKTRADMSTDSQNHLESCHGFEASDTLDVVVKEGRNY